MIKAVLRERGIIQLVPETDAEEERVRVFALEKGIDEDDFCGKASISLSPPIICRGRRVKRRTLNIRLLCRRR